MSRFAGTTVVFRTDASLRIGTGHVVRCLTLAAALRAEGADCTFVCREHPGHLARAIRNRGFEVTLLPSVSLGSAHPAITVHDEWLGGDWSTDAALTTRALERRPNWIVVDHYALDARWEDALADHAGAILAIDDLADRDHRCDILLDQNLGHDTSTYHGRLSHNCLALVGPSYALLRPEFAAVRQYSLSRRRGGDLKHLLISLGGVDQANTTSALLGALSKCKLPVDLDIVVVLGPTAPWIADVRKVAANMVRPTRVLVDVPDMAQLMADSDLALGAAGVTSWERCCVGLPAIVVELAANQRGILEALGEAGAVKALPISAGEGPDWTLLPELLESIAEPATLNQLAANAARIVDGHGTGRVLAAMATRRRAV